MSRKLLLDDIAWELQYDDDRAAFSSIAEAHASLSSEVARPEQVFRTFRDRTFTCPELRTKAGSLECNEFMFPRS